MRTKLPPGTLDKWWNDQANWRGAFFYVCKLDPRLLVPKRNRWAGWTMNFAHPKAWAQLVLGIAFSIALVSAAAASHRPAVIAGAVAFIVVGSIVMGRWCSSTKRFEERP